MPGGQLKRHEYESSNGCERWKRFPAKNSQFSQKLAPGRHDREKSSVEWDYCKRQQGYGYRSNCGWATWRTRLFRYAGTALA